MFSKIKESDIVTARVFSAKRIVSGRKPNEIAVSSNQAFELLSALVPNRRDPMPLDWQGLGRLEFTITFGREYCVYLFQTSDREDAAFSVNGIYYRGGSNDRLINLIREAEGLMENKEEHGDK